MSSNEALVLFEWVHRNENLDTRLDHVGVADEAERTVLWNLSASLETVLVAPFQADYLDALESARAALRPDAR